VYFLFFAGAHEVSNNAQKHIQVNVTFFVSTKFSDFHSVLHIKLSVIFNFAN
jgi:hypothetical protein